MSKIAQQTDWDTKPMPERHEEFILKRDMSMAELEILKKGHIPRAMEDKWFWYYQDGKLYAHRSWTGYCVYIMEIDFARCEHKVIVNRDDRQYKEKSIEVDRAKLNELLDWWSQPQYDFYNQWISESYHNILNDNISLQKEMNETVFEIFGIENKELQVSNLFAYYFDYCRNGYRARDFLNEFLKLAGKDTIETYESYNVKREYFLKFKEYQNSIDILIIVGDEANPKRVICIENKVISKEGILQTKRYYEAVEHFFGGAGKRDYIYMTKNNSKVELSSDTFSHIRYRDIAKVLMQDAFHNMKYAEDFCEYYVQREERIFSEIEENDRLIEQNNSDDFSLLIDYLVWKINASDVSSKYKYVFFQKDVSAKSSKQFFKTYLESWFFELTAGGHTKSMSIHLEGYENSVVLHMEVAPYEQFSKLEERYGKEFFDEYVNLRDSLRRKMILADGCGYHSVKLSWHADLSIAKFEIEADSYMKYLEAIIRLIYAVDEKISKVNKNE